MENTGNEMNTGKGNTIKDPDNWSTGDEPMTGAQKSYLETLAQQTGENIDEGLSKAAASKKIEELKNDNPTGSKNENALSNTVKNPDDWKTGDEPITGAQKSYLKTLTDEAGEPMNENITKAEASKQIEALQQQTGRGVDDKSS